MKPDSSEFKFEDPDFEVFYEKFISDSAFQISNLNLPLSGNYSDYNGSRDWNIAEWPLITWDFRTEMNTTDDSVSITQNDTDFFFETRCTDCGFSFEMRFEKISDNWKMTHRQENNF